MNAHFECLFRAPGINNFSVAICHLAVTMFLYFRLPIKNPPKRVFILMNFRLPSFGIALHRGGRLLSIPDNGHVGAYHTHRRISDRHQRKRGKVLWQTHFLRSWTERPGGICWRIVCPSWCIHASFQAPLQPGMMRHSYHKLLRRDSRLRCTFWICQSCFLLS